MNNHKELPTNPVNVVRIAKGILQKWEHKRTVGAFVFPNSLKFRPTVFGPTLSHFHRWGEILRGGVDHTSVGATCRPCGVKTSKIIPE